MDWIEQTKQHAEREMMEKEIQRIAHGPQDAPVEYVWRGEAWLRLPRWAAEKAIRMEYAEGLRHRPRTKAEVFDFMDRHGLPWEIIDRAAEADARVDAEAHKRMRAAALNRRSRMPPHSTTMGRAFL